MKSDFKLLPLALLAQEYQATFQSLYSEALAHEAAVQDSTWHRKYNATLARLQELASNSEAGSDGLEEQASELCGTPSPAVLSEGDHAKIRLAARQAVVPAWIEREGIAHKLSWLPQQMMAYFGAWEAVKADNTYSPSLTAKRNTQDKNDLFALGALLLAKSSRGDFFKGAPKGSQQYKSPINPLVPIVLAGFKRYQNIPYEAWNRAEIAHLVDSEIAQLATTKVPSLQPSEILAIRNNALTPKSGPRAGKSNNPATTATLYHLQETAIGHLPKLARHLVLQTWAAHPQNRDKYAILDCENWDSAPPPLVDGVDLFLPDPKPQPSWLPRTPVEGMPWL